MWQAQIHFDVLNHEKNIQILHRVKETNKKTQRKLKEKAGDFSAGAVVQYAKMTFFGT